MQRPGYRFGQALHCWKNACLIVTVFSHKTHPNKSQRVGIESNAGVFNNFCYLNPIVIAKQGFNKLSRFDVYVESPFFQIGYFFNDHYFTAGEFFENG